MRVKDMPREQQKAVFAKMIDANYLNRLESAEHAHARLEYLRKRHDLAETTEDKIWDVWNDKKLTHTQKMAEIRMIKGKAAEKLKDYQKAETAPTVAGEYKKRQWSQFEKKKYSLEAVPNNPATEPVTFERGSQARAERDVIARDLEKHKNEIKEPYAVATNMVKSGAKAEDREAVARGLKEQTAIAHHRPSYIRQSPFYYLKRKDQPSFIKREKEAAEARARKSERNMAIERAAAAKELKEQKIVAAATDRRAYISAVEHAKQLRRARAAEKRTAYHNKSDDQLKVERWEKDFAKRGSAAGMRPFTRSEMTERQRFEHNIAQFPEYKEMKAKGFTHNEAINKTMQARNIKAGEGKMWFQAKVPPFTLKPVTHNL